MVLDAPTVQSPGSPFQDRFTDVSGSLVITFAECTHKIAVSRAEPCDRRRSEPQSLLVFARADLSAEKRRLLRSGHNLQARSARPSLSISAMETGTIVWFV